MLTVLACIFVFGILISVHEFGHFICAKLTGMRVDEFSIGFGPELYSNQDGETLYSLRASPLGGYNKIAGMDPGDPVDDRSFKAKPLPARMLVILAGSFMNILLPVLIFWILFMTEGIGMPVDKPVLGQVVPGYAAAESGLLPEDKVLSVNGKAVTSWQEMRTQLLAGGMQPLELKIQRQDLVKTYTVTPRANPETGKPFIGVVAKMDKQRLGPVTALKTSVIATADTIKEMLTALYKMVTGKTAAEVSGPIGVAKMAGQVAHQGISMLFQFTALLSLNLAVINLLPLPALDGGHFFLLLWEGVTGRKVGEKAMQNIQTAGIIMILAITIFATYKDLLR